MLIFQRSRKTPFPPQGETQPTIFVAGIARTQKAQANQERTYILQRNPPWAPCDLCPPAVRPRAPRTGGNGA